MCPRNDETQKTTDGLPYFSSSAFLHSGLSAERLLREEADVFYPCLPDLIQNRKSIAVLGARVDVQVNSLLRAISYSLADFFQQVLDRDFIVAEEEAAVTG